MPELPLLTSFRLTVIAGLACGLGACASPKDAAPRLAGTNVQTRREIAVDALQDARSAWEKLRQGQPGALAAYNAATRQFVDVLAATDPSVWNRSRPVQTDRGILTYGVDDSGRGGAWKVDTFERVESIEHPVVNLVVPGAQRAGAGVPLIARVRQIVRNGGKDPGYPPKGQFAPATAVLDFSEKLDQVTLRLLDPRDAPNVRLAGRELTVAADFASAEHRRLGGDNFLSIALGGLLRPEKFAEERGIYLAEPYRPDKIPVLLIHGLASDPRIWENLAATIGSDPALGRRYQIWYYIYPTGPGVPTSARWLRRQLAEVRRFHDPMGLHAGPRRTVLVGHSMGGILAHLMVVDSGDDFRKAYITKSLDQATLTAKQRELAQDFLYWKKPAGMSRAVFLAAPHRGATLAQNPLATFASWLVRLPLAALQDATSILTLNRNILNPEILKTNKILNTSIETLAPTHPYFKALAARPILTPYHSIIGNRGKAGEIEKSSDGFVPYWSSHLKGARTELIVPYPHSLVEKPESVAEVVRILREHLKK